MVHQGSWAVTVDGERILVSPGDVFAIPPNTNRTIEPTMTGETAAFLVRNTDDSAGLTHVGE
jgi:mannose-6-phosphate isomerase-like protein (cupin superfamily)